MPRMSFRSLWTVARSGLLFSLLLCAGSSSSSLLAQDGSEYMGVEMAGSQQQSAGLTNRNSGIKRTENSLGRVQALLYPDAVNVLHANLVKIDYEGISAFVDEVVDQAGGTVQSSDQYRVDLREYQKSQVKSSFKALASTFQNALVKECFDKKIDEIYRITYQNGKDPGCVIYAVPIDGLSAEDQNTALEALDSRFSPIATFKRFGFIIAVTDHDSAIKPDLENIQAKYLAKAEEAQKNVYGAYSVSGNRGNAYGLTGASGINTMLGGAATQNANPQNQLLSEYLEEVEAAKKAARVESRSKALPFVRKRFSAPADSGDLTGLLEALTIGDGAFLTFATVGNADIEAQLSQDATDSDIASPFAGLGSSAVQTGDKEKDELSTAVLEVVKGNGSVNSQNVTIALSLVGTPKLLYVAKYSDADVAKDCADVFTGALAAVKTIVKDNVDKQIQESEIEEAVDFTPVIDDIFNALRPEVKDSKVAVMIDLDVLKKNAAAFMPLLGGKEAKTAVELESESIDWSVADESNEATGETAKPDANDDPFSAEDTEEESPIQDAVQAGEDEDDPFGENEEDDPFGDDSDF